jgi:hypothetical protein
MRKDQSIHLSFHIFDLLFSFRDARYGKTKKELSKVEIALPQKII